MRSQRGAHEQSRPSTGIGARLREARLRAGLTQQRLAGERYTKAYVSALEHGLVNPSMVALEYLASRLGMSASRLLADDQARWTRPEAELALASGRWQAATDLLDGLFASAVDPIERAEVLLGQAEALNGLGRRAEAAAAATGALAIFESGGSHEGAALATYWLARSRQAEDPEQARELLEQLLRRIKDGLPVGPDLEARVLLTLHALAAAQDDAAGAQQWLGDLRAVRGALDEQRRAEHLAGQATSHHRRGEFEAAARAAYGAAALLRSAALVREIAGLDTEALADPGVVLELSGDPLGA